MKAAAETIPAGEAPPAGGRRDPDGAWLRERERGSATGIELFLALARLLGRRGTRPIVHAVALWYRLFDRRSVRASRGWLERIHGRRPGFWEVYRHLLVFAQVTVDRLFLLTGRTKGLTFDRTGSHYLQQQAASGRGAVLLGAHVGSYEAMRARGAAENVPIKILGYFKNARRINDVLERLNPGQAAEVIHLGEDPLSATLRAREAIERGELVAILGDRVGLSDRTVRLPFLGAEADFPAGPFLLASLLHCPVYLVFGLYHHPDRYALYCEPFAERLELPRQRRDEALREVVGRYAERLEHYCREAPDNWFNFFDFWSTR